MMWRSSCFRTSDRGRFSAPNKRVHVLLECFFLRTQSNVCRIATLQPPGCEFWDQIERVLLSQENNSRSWDVVLALTRVDLNQNPRFRASLREVCGRKLDNNRPYFLQTQAAAPNFICSALWAKCPEVLFAWGWKLQTRAHRHATHACPSSVFLFLITFLQS